MKLSNLSLAVLVALGVAACGGSDDNNNAPQDPPPPGDNNNGGNTPPPPADNSQKPQDPARVAPGNEVQDAVKQHVVAAKTTYASAGTRDLLTGYAPGVGIVAVGNDPRVNDATVYFRNSTKEHDVKRVSSRINYVATGQLRTNAQVSDRNGTVLANPGFTYALGSDGNWHRMVPANNQNWDETTLDTRYVPVDTAHNDKFPGGRVRQDALFFLPNVEAQVGAPEQAGGLLVGNERGINLVDPEVNSGNFDTNRGEVIFKTAEFNGKSYDISTAKAIDKVDLNSIAIDKNAVQYLPVKLNYDVKDTKGTTTLVDDTVTALTAEAGAMKAYNLPYSLALVTVNQTGAEKGRVQAGAQARNFFDYPNRQNYGDLGAYQVVGYQSPYLPRNGRADYVGKSFGVDSVGDIKLRADFGATGAHIAGSVNNRTYSDGSGTLPDIILANIQLSAPGTRLNTTGTELFGNQAQRGQARAFAETGNWDVQLFGPDAEEAGGVIRGFADAVIPGGIEVFTSQRGVITQDSNIAPTP